MKSFFFVLIFLFCFGTLAGQTVTGKVVDVSTGEPLVYVNVGVIGQSRGTITDETGAFKLEINELPGEATVRFSMIGYIAETYTVKQLLDNNGKTIMLESTSIPLSEVVIKPGTLRKQRIIGATRRALSGTSGGWGGSIYYGLGTGCEFGVKMELGKLPVHIKSLHIHFSQQTFDSCLLRLHIRNIVNELPGDELLKQNIYIPLTKGDGWVEVDLSSHNLVFQGDIALSLEMISGGRKMPYSPNMFFSYSNKKGSTYIKKGSEGTWKRLEQVLLFYLTVI